MRGGSSAAGRREMKARPLPLNQAPSVGCMVQGFGFRVPGLGLRVKGLGLRFEVWETWFIIEGLGLFLQVQFLNSGCGFGFQVSS